MKDRVVLFSRSEEAYGFVVKSLSERYECAYERDLCDGFEELELAIFDVPNGDRSWITKAYEFNDAYIAVVIIVSEKYYTQTVREALPKGAMVLKKPMSSDSLLLACDLAMAANYRLRKLERRNQSLKDRLSDINLVNRAKWLLIENMNMSEDEAHHYIEKQAMDTSLTLREVASNIIRTYSR